MPARLAPSHPRAALPAGRAGAGKEKRGAKGRGRPGKGGGRLGRLAGGFIVSFRPPPPAPRPRRHWKAARAARRLVIYSAGCARVTEPGPADGAADALGRGAESAGLRAGRRRQWASVCAAAVAAGGRGPGEGGGRLPGSPLCRPRAPESMSREGDLSSRGRPLCEPRGAGPVPRASSWGCGDRGAGSAGQVTYPGLRVGGLCLGREEGSRDGCERRAALPGLRSPLFAPLACALEANLGV
ncbi:translation initiation factor IF-2-like isoform X2 [Trachypithecus francoisi]|uniref:translation initiation factor IF-2-like isoform X2 n=1 Tax=Trachypithecus francoisi TaxID=54180 RepID=UPI00141B5688|nr:translation initiation factor IF-2-like isoform X2 [Trachypithecus francoisi]